MSPVNGAEVMASLSEVLIKRQGSRGRREKLSEGSVGQSLASTRAGPAADPA